MQICASVGSDIIPYFSNGAVFLHNRKKSQIEEMGIRDPSGKPEPVLTSINLDECDFRQLSPLPPLCFVSNNILIFFPLSLFWVPV